MTSSQQQRGGSEEQREDPAVRSADVSERLLARGREAQRRKVELLKERESEDARNAQRVVPTNKVSKDIAMNSEGIRCKFNCKL